MAQKPKIEYVKDTGYLYGAEAPSFADYYKQWKAMLPKRKKEHVRKVTVDPVATVCLIAAVAVMAMLIGGCLQMRQTMAEYNALQQKLSDLKRENASLSHSYHTSYDLEEIREQAKKIGMIEAAETERFTVIFSVPEAEEEPTAWDEFVWLISGLFSNPRRADAS